MAKKQEEIVTKFGATVLSKYSAQDIRDVRVILRGGGALPQTRVLTSVTGRQKLVQQLAQEECARDCRCRGRGR